MIAASALDEEERIRRIIVETTLHTAPLLATAQKFATTFVHSVAIGDPAAADSSGSGGVATFYKPLPGQVDDVVQAHAADKAARPDAWSTHRYEAVLAVDDPDVSGTVRPEGMPLPRIYEQGEADEGAWRCASCYRGRFKTMCFGGNSAGAAACAHCSKPRAEAGWSIWLPFAELPIGWQSKLTARYAPSAVKLLQTKWPGAAIEWDGFPKTRPHV